MKKLSLFIFLSIIFTFTISCISREVPVTETYYETVSKTEYKTETYTDTEDVVVNRSEGKTVLGPISKWRAPLYFSAEGSGTGAIYFYGYEIDASKHTRSQVKIVISPTAEGIIGVYDLTGITPVNGSIWEWFNPNEPGWNFSPTIAGKLTDITSNSRRTLTFQPIGTEMAKEISFDAKDIKEFVILVNTLHVSPINTVQMLWSDDISEKQVVTKERQVPYEVPVQVEKQRTVIKTKKVPIWNIWIATESPTSPSESMSDNTEPSAELPSSHPIISEVNTPAELSPPKIMYEDDCSKPGGGFASRVVSDYKTEYKDGEYHILVDKSDWFVWQTNARAGLLSDFTFAIDARLVTDSNNGFYGIIFRTENNDNFYCLQIASGGGYMIGERLNSSWFTLKPWTTSEYINKDFGINHIEVICENSLIVVNINGHNLTTIDDPNHFTSGHIGVIVYSPSGNTQVAFDNLKVYTAN